MLLLGGGERAEVYPNPRREQRPARLISLPRKERYPRRLSDATDRAGAAAAPQTLVQLRAPAAIRGRVIGLYQMGALGMRAFSGVTIGVVGGLIGIHWSLALSAMALLAVIMGLLAFTLRARPT